MPDAPVIRHTRFSPVFVVGYARSGTSLTCRLLLDYLRVNFGTESQFIIRFHRRLASYGDLSDDRNVRLLLDDIGRERFFVRTKRNFGFALDADRALRELDGRTYAAVLRSIFGQFATSQAMVRWGDKTPAYNRHLPVLLELFPDAQFIHVVRDGRDVALSVFKSGFGPKNVYEAAVDWRRSLADIRQFGAGLPREQFIEFRYEDLIERPADTIGSLAAFLGITDPDDVAAAFAERLRAHVRPDNCQKWRYGLAPRDIECFEAFGAAELANTGYPVVSPSASRRVGAHERLFWYLQGRWRRLSRRAYWADNWYKLRLRARELGLPLRTLAR